MPVLPEGDPFQAASVLSLVVMTPAGNQIGNERVGAVGHEAAGKILVPPRRRRVVEMGEEGFE